MPGKPLELIDGQPMIERVYERASQARGLDRVVVLTDDERIATVVQSFGGDVEMTPANCPSGTDRIAVAAQQWFTDGVVNIQGDEPLIDPGAIDAIADYLRQVATAQVVTLAAPARERELDDPNAVKVVCNRSGDALYFSRARIPYHRDPDTTSAPRVLKHLGIYGYRRDTLLHLAALEPTPLEKTEALEQLRALEHGIPIHVLIAEHAEPGVDTAEDLARASARWHAIARKQEPA